MLTYFGELFKPMSNATLIIKHGKTQHGFSLIELMISMVIGLIAIAGMISIFASSVKSNTDSLEMVRLNQELRAIMDVMVRDIRRTGYWSKADGVTANPFMNISTNAAKDCITYSYDRNPYTLAAGLAVLENEDNFGFRLHNNAVKLRQNSTTCDSTTNWVNLSDSSAINISVLTFGLANSFCKNLSSGVVEDGTVCVDAISEDVMSTMYVVDITITGNLIADPTVAATFAEQVVVRNTKFEVMP